MTWFDILKLGGEDLLGGEKLSNDLYEDGESSGRVADYFYNQKDKVTTRPHFEQQAKRKFSEEIDGDLQAIADLIGDKGSRNVRYFGFTSEQRDHLITWRIVGKEEIYPKSKKLLKPINLENDSRVIVFDSVYRVRELQKGNINIDGKFMPLFSNDQAEWDNIKQKKTEGRGGTIDIYSNLGEWNKENARLEEKMKGAKSAGNFKSFEDYKKQIEDHEKKHPRNQNTNNPNKPRRRQGRRFR
tara:strand:+ start:220 stop:945 length:726 start_codon:yes stop_codon:yes gene_type:complete